MAVSRSVLRVTLATAAALFGPGAAWVLFQQGEGGLVYFACAAAGPPLGAALGLAAIALCGAAGALAWQVVRSDPDATRRFLGRIGLGASAIFALASLVMTAAIWLVPPCAR
ncbi:hypothetical protein [Phenylobacterium sp.]|jgi:hypothetical protein|uniref:hypothetical protein n=1 Tax=Phenylobacterium sp. TaxID=1871053 RepID=UPI002F3FA354